MAYANRALYLIPSSKKNKTKPNQNNPKQSNKKPTTIAKTRQSPELFSKSRADLHFVLGEAGPV